MSPDEAWDTFEDLATNSELWDDFGPRKFPPAQPTTQVSKVHNASSEPSGDDLMCTQFDRLEAAFNKKIDMLLQAQSKISSRQVNNVASSPPCFYCGSLSHEAEECAYFVELEKEERQHVNQVSSYSQGPYQAPPRPYNTYTPRNEHGRTQGHQPRAYGSNVQGYQEKPQGSGTYGGYKSSTYGASPGFSNQGGHNFN